MRPKYPSGLRLRTRLPNRIALATLTLTVALVASAAGIAAFQSSERSASVILPGDTVHFRSLGTVTVGSETHRIDSWDSGMNLICHEKGEIVSSLFISNVFDGSESYDEYRLCLSKYDSSPAGGKKMAQSVLGKPPEPGHSVYYLEHDSGAKFEFHVNERERFAKTILCKYSGLVNGGGSDGRMGDFELTLYALGNPAHGFPVSGKAFGPWKYDLAKSSGTHGPPMAVLMVECVSDFRINDAIFLLPDSAVSKYCRVSLLDGGASLVEAEYAEFYGSGIPDVASTPDSGMYAYELTWRLGHMCEDGGYAYGTVVLKIGSDSEHANTSKTSIEMSFNITKLEYDLDGNVTSQSQSAASYEAVL